MKQIFLELWIENKQIPILLILKILLLSLSLILGVLLRGFPFVILVLFIAMTLQTITPKFLGQVEYLIPLSDRDRNKNQILKSATIAGVYSIANAIGYILTISLEESYQWDGEMIVFMSVMVVFSFILIFDFRLLFERVRYFNLNDTTKDKKSKRIADTIGFEGITPLLAILCIALFLFYKLYRLEAILFLGTGYWRIMSLIVIGVEFVLLCVGTWTRCRSIEIQDCCD